MKKGLITAGVIIILALIVWASLRETGPKGIPVDVQAVTRRTISSRVKATGEITPEKRVEISAKIVGEIINLPVVEGQKVTAGQLLLEIERDLYEAARNQARAALRQAEVSVHRQEVQIADARRQLDRMRKLIAEGLASQESLDAAQLRLDTALVELESAKHAVEQHRSALQRAEDDLTRTTIRSPMNGVIIQLNAEKGETVVPGSTNLPGSVIMTVADMSVLLAQVEVNEVDVVDVRLGQDAEISLDALSGEPLRGHVVEIATSGRKDPALGTIRFLVKVAIENPDPALRPAMTAKVAILTEKRTDVLTVPIQAVLKRKLNEEGKEVKDKGIEKKDVVYLIDSGLARVQPVTTGISDELYVEITTGVSDNQEVIIGPYKSLKRLHAGDAVRVRDNDSPEKPAKDTSS